MEPGPEGGGMKSAVLLFVSAVLLFMAGALFGGGSQATPLGSSEWKSLGGSGLPILHSRRGKVYRFFTDCDKEGRNGCLVELPVYEKEEGGDSWKQ